MTKRAQILWTGANGQTYHLTLDVSEREQHSAPAEITDHPVESGVNFSDHIRPLPDMVTINGIISNMPIFLPPDFADGVAFQAVTIQGPPRTTRVGNFVPAGLPRGGPVGALAPIGTALATIPITRPGEIATARGFSAPFDRVAGAWAALRQIRDNGLLVSIVTTLHTYDSMGLQSVDVTRDVKSGNALVFTLVGKQIRVGRTEVVSVPVIPTRRVDKGRKTAKEPEVAPPADSESFLSRGVEAAASLF